MNAYIHNHINELYEREQARLLDQKLKLQQLQHHQNGET